MQLGQPVPTLSGGELETGTAGRCHLAENGALKPKDAKGRLA